MDPYICACLVDEVLCSLCPGLSFQRFLNVEHPWEIKRMSPSKAEVKHIHPAH